MWRYALTVTSALILVNVLIKYKVIETGIRWSFALFALYMSCKNQQKERHCGRYMRHQQAYVML